MNTYETDGSRITMRPKLAPGQPHTRGKVIGVATDAGWARIIVDALNAHPPRRVVDDESFPVTASEVGMAW
jgi:hypothetical protein